MIFAKNLVKNYGEQQVLKDVSFEVKPQEIFALLGPSGAGKTTIINILTNWIAPDGGEAKIGAGQDEIGIMLDAGGIYDDLSCQENLALYAGLFSLQKSSISDVLESVGIGDSSKKTVKTLSRGMKQRLALARAIISKPKVLILDEPTSALDPGTAKNICDLLQKYREGGATIFLTTHNMDEALKLCDRVALLHNGQIIEQGNPVELCEKRNAIRTVPDLEAVFLELTGVQL
jgi:ABC-2 type transport system ATP-binding protein